LKRCIYKKSNYLTCEDFIIDIKNECVYKTSNGGCVYGDDVRCVKCGQKMYYQDDQWHCMCGEERGLK